MDLKKLLLIVFVILAALLGYFLFREKDDPQTEGVATESKQYKYVDPDKYKPILSTNPAWYLDPVVRKDINNYLQSDEEKMGEEFVKEKHEFFQFIGDSIAAGEIKLGTSGDNRDEERKEVDSIVIHHTQTSPSRDIRWLNGLQLLTLYVPVFSNPNKNEEYGKPIWSNHFDENGKMLFIAYHYLVYPNGRVENPLEDKEIGWHAGDWDYNTRSVGIAFVDDLTNKEPTDEALKAAKEIIDKYKAKDPDIEIVGHKEIDPGHTACPGEEFDNWKDDLLS